MKPKKYKAYIRWFDSMRGDGLVRLESGESIYIYFTSIIGWKKGNWCVPSKADQCKNIRNRDCVVTIIRDSHYRQVGECKLLRTKQNGRKWFESKFKKCERCGEFIGMK